MASFHPVAGGIRDLTLEPKKSELQAMQEAKFAVNVCSAAWWLQPI